MNRDIAKAIETRMITLLSPMEKELGVKVTAKGGTIGDTYVTLKFEVAEVKKDGVAETREAQDFKRMARYYGLSAKMLNLPFRNGSDTFQVIGLKPKSRKWPVLAKNVRTGKIYKFQTTQVKAGWIGELPEGIVNAYDDAELERQIAQMEGDDE